MSFFVKNIKISNFLSFFGDHEVELKPYTGIICNSDQGREDFFKAIEFVFGKNLFDINSENILDLINPNINGFDDEETDENCYVEVILKFFDERKDSLQMRRAVVNREIKFSIDNQSVSVAQYQKKLDDLGLNIKNKELIFYRDDFSHVIWGTAEALEKVLNKCLRVPFLGEECEKIRRKVKHLQEFEKILSDRKYDICRENHDTVFEVIRRWEKTTDILTSSRQKFLASIKKHLEGRTEGAIEQNSDESSQEDVEEISDQDSEDISPVLSPYSEEFNRLEEEKERMTNKILELETKLENLKDEYNDSNLGQSVLLAELYCSEVKMAKTSDNSNLLKDRMEEIKELLDEEKSKFLAIDKKRKKLESKLGRISKDILKNFALIQEIRYDSKSQVNLSLFGRLADHISPSPNLNLLRNILGDDLFYANLVDTEEEVSNCLKYLKAYHYKQDEIFIIFDGYPENLKYFILTSGEIKLKVDISSFEKLLIFLFKLKNYGLISKVPIIMKKAINNDELNMERASGIVFIPDGIILSPDGLITRINQYAETNLENDEQVILKRLNELILDQEMKFYEMYDLNTQEFETKLKIFSLEEDAFFIKRHLEITAQSTQGMDTTTPIPIAIPDIYKEFMEYFTEHDNALRLAEEELQRSELKGVTPIMSGESSSSTPSQSSGSQQYYEKLQNIRLLESELAEMRKTILTTETELRKLYASAFCLKQFPWGGVAKTTILSNKLSMFYVQEIASIKKLIDEKEIKNFLHNEEIIEYILESLEEQLSDNQQEIQDLKKDLQDIIKQRKKYLKSLLEHCNQYFFRTVTDILHTAIPFLEIGFDNSQNELQILTSLKEERVKLVDSKILNTALKFIVALSLFLQISVSEKTPIIILDNVWNFLPDCGESVKGIFSDILLNLIIPNSEDVSFDLKMRIGQYLQLFIKKNITRTPIRMNLIQKINGPSQLLFFADSDFVLSPEHQILISQKILPHECITAKSPYFSAIYAVP